MADAVTVTAVRRVCSMTWPFAAVPTVLSIEANLERQQHLRHRRKHQNCQPLA